MFALVDSYGSKRIERSLDGFVGSAGFDSDTSGDHDDTNELGTVTH